MRKMLLHRRPDLQPEYYHCSDCYWSHTEAEFLAEYDPRVTYHHEIAQLAFEKHLCEDYATQGKVEDGGKAKEPAARRWPVSENINAKMVDAAVCTRIRDRAYELYCRRGRYEGLAVHDWLQAEAEVWDELKVQPTTATSVPANGANGA